MLLCSLKYHCLSLLFLCASREFFIAQLTNSKVNCSYSKYFPQFFTCVNKYFGAGSKPYF